MNRTADRADAEPGSAEIQVVWTLRPVRGTDAEDMLSVRRLHAAHRAVAALAGLQARKIVPALGSLLEYIRRNREHFLNFLPLLLNFDASSGRAY